MKTRLAEVTERRHRILEKIALQRMEVTAISKYWQKPVALIDTGLQAIRFIHKHPAFVSGCMTAFLTWRNKGVAGLAHEGWLALSRNPSALSSGMKYISSLIHSPSKEE